MQYLKQSTAATFRIGPFLDDTDGKTAETGLTITQADIRLSKAGGAFAQKNDATAASHDENGWYTCVLNTTDTNTLGTLIIAVHEAGALPVWREFSVLAANVYDSLIGGGDSLEVDMTAISGDSAAADNLESIMDGTGAVMTLSQLRIDSAAAGGAIDIDNSAGDGIHIVSGNNGDAINLNGHGTGGAVKMIPGATGKGLSIAGGSTSGHAIDISATSGDGIKIQGGLAGMGIWCKAGIYGTGMVITGGDNTGNGLSISALAGIGINVISTNGHGINIDANGAACTGIKIDSAAHYGVEVTGVTGTRISGTTDGLSLDALRNGLRVSGNPAVEVNTDGNGILVSTQGYGMKIASGLEGLEINSGNEEAVIFKTTGTGKTAFAIEGDAAGNDIEAREIGDRFTIDGVTGAGILDVLKKLSDDNGGADFDSTTDSLHEISRCISTISALTAQEIRDAMKLAPSAGAPFSDSIDDKLDQLEMDLNTISINVDSIVTNVGTPVTLDGGAASLAGMLIKFADDNGGADFDSTTDSLHEISGDLNTLTYNIFDEIIDEPLPGKPDAEPTFKTVIRWIWAQIRNKGTFDKSSMEKKVYNDAGSALAKKIVSDSGTVYTENEMDNP